MSTENRTYALKTLGCKANLYDSQLIETELQKRGWTPARGDDTAALCIVNSCTVTDEADRQSRRMARKAAGAGTQVVMTGCGAEVAPESYRPADGVHYVVGNQNKDRLVDLVLQALDGHEAQAAVGAAEEAIRLGGVAPYEKILSRHPMDREWAAPESSFMLPPIQQAGDADRTRSFIKIQEGCDSFCTYCIIPYGRGPSRSLGIPAIVEQVRKLVSEGAREVILTGTNIGDYGADHAGSPQLEALVEALLNETELQRLRLSSLDPVEVSPRLRELMAASPRLCPHFHVSLQSTSSRVLKLMKRKYAEADVTACLQAIAEVPAPVGGAFVGMDIITGFPGETAEEFERSTELLRTLPWSRLHVFPYSERAGTPATRLPEVVPPGERSRRAKVLRELSFARVQEHHQSVLAESKKTGRGLDRVLLESLASGPDASSLWIAGYSSNYLRVLVPVRTREEADRLRNQVVSFRPESVITDRASGEAAFLGSIS